MHHERKLKNNHLQRIDWLVSKPIASHSMFSTPCSLAVSSDMLGLPGWKPLVLPSHDAFFPRSLIQGEGGSCLQDVSQ